MSTKRSQPKPEGRLELTWTNKHLRLIDDLDGSYEWVVPSDWRVAEVRLLDDVETVGEVHTDDQRALDNLLIEGDALAALRALTNLPEFAKHHLGQVKLAYIDPPFNTGETFSDYEDNIEHSVWLTMLRDRLVQIKKLLRPDGSVWVHLDDSEAHRARSVLDEVFGASNHVATVVWQKLYARKSNQQISTSHDYIFVYAKEGARFETNDLPPSDELLARYTNRDDDPRGPWQSVAFSVRTDNPARRAEYRYEVELPSGRKVGPPRGRHWNGKRDRFERLKKDGRLWFGEDGDSLPREKVFLEEVNPGLVPITWWPRDEVGDNDESKAEILSLFPDVDDVFQTPKPERLLERILHVATSKGDLVLDCFAGSGTTAAVAHKMQRRWITVERSSETIKTYTAPRLGKVVDGTDRGGISEQEVSEFVGDLPGLLSPGEGKAGVRVLKAMREDDRFSDTVEKALRKAGVALNGTDPSSVAELVVKGIETELRKSDKSKRKVELRWSGGGGFRVLRVAPSMFQPDDDGRIYLAAWASCQDRLGQAVAAQLGYDYNVDGSFLGVKGRRRLAVIDGLVSRPVLEALAQDLPAGETMEVLGRAVADDATETARQLVKGAKVRKIPTELLLNWRRTEGGRA